MYTLSDAAQIAGIPVATVRTWFGRGHLQMHEQDREAMFPGDTRYLSGRTVLAVAIAAEFARLGLPLARAAYAANMFAHTNAGNPMRGRPGALYPGPGAVGTVLIVRATGSVQIARIDGRTTALALLAHAGDGGAATLVVDPIVRRVAEALKR